MIVDYIGNIFLEDIMKTMTNIFICFRIIILYRILYTVQETANFLLT